MGKNSTGQQASGTDGTALQLDLPVFGMSSPICAKRIESVLSESPGVILAGVDFASATASILYEPKRTGGDELAEIVSSLGFTTGWRGRVEWVAPEGVTFKVQGPLLAGAIGLVLLSMEALRNQWEWIDFPGLDAIRLGLATIAVFRGGRVILSRAWRAFRHRVATIETLIAAGVGTAFATAAGHLVFPDFVGEAAPIEIEWPPILLATSSLGLAFSEWVITLPRSRFAGKSGERLHWATLVRGDFEVVVPIESVSNGDVLVVMPGTAVPVDGKVVEGASEVDESALSPTAQPQPKRPGDLVFEGTLNRTGKLLVRTERAGSVSALERIRRLEAGAGAGSEKMAQRLVGVIAPLSGCLSIAVFTAWFVFLPEEVRYSGALVRSVALLLGTASGGIWMAIPAAFSAGAAMAVARRIYFKGADALLEAARLKSIVFEVDGVLTNGQPRLLEVVDLPGAELSQTQAVWLAASTGRNSENPWFSGIVHEAKARSLRLGLPDMIHARKENFVEAEFADCHVLLGDGAALHSRGIGFEGFGRWPSQIEASGLFPIFLIVEGKAAGLFGLAHRLRRGSREAAARLRSLGVEASAFCHSNDFAARAVCRRIGIETVQPTSPHQFGPFTATRRELTDQRAGSVGRSLVAPSFFGLVLGADPLIRDVGEVTLLHDDPQSVATAVELARSVRRVLRQNLFLVALYLIVVIPAAAGFLHPTLGWLLSPLWATCAAASCGVAVGLNALRINRVEQVPIYIFQATRQWVGERRLTGFEEESGDH